MLRPTPKSVPYDVGSMDLEHAPDPGFAWPRPFSTVVPALRQQIRHFTDFAAALDDPAERTVVIGAYALLNPVQGFLEAALYLNAEEAADLRMVGKNWQLEYLRSGAIDDQPPPAITSKLLAFKATPGFSFLRNLKVTAQMNGLRFPSCLANPTATTIAINPLIASAFGQPGNRIRFAYPERFLHGSKPAPAVSPYRIDVEDLAQRLATHLVSVQTLDEEIRRRLYFLVERECRHALKTVRDHLGQVSTIRKLPNVLWSGTGGRYLNRLIGIEQMRRGNRIKRFAHGAMASLLLKRSELATLTEFSVSSEFVFASSKFLGLIRQIGVLDDVPGRFSCTYSALDLAPAGPAAAGRGEAKRSRRRVLYAPTLPRGFGLYQSPDLRESLYIDWRLKLIQRLKQMPVDLVVKFHPAETRTGFRHPVPEQVEITEIPFEELLEEVDVVVLDYFKTSTLPLAMCTTKPVVLIDIDHSDFRREFAVELEKRCRIIASGYSVENLPSVDGAALEEAVCAGPDQEDPTFFRSIY